MAEPGPQASDIPAPQPPPTPEDPQPPAQPTPQPHHGQHIININWSNFKPEFSGKPGEDAAPLLQTNYWMNAHHFLEDIKVKRFCLTLVGDDSLWYQSLEPINVDWQGLQICLDNIPK